jgi:hypothetical protein
MNSDDYYKLLSTDEPLVKYYIEPNNVRKLLENDDVITGEADISPEQRFMCDSFYDTEFPTDIKPRVYYLDIETYVTDDILPKFNHNVSDINAITIYDNYSKEYYTWGLVPNYDEQDDVIEDRIIQYTK